MAISNPISPLIIHGIHECIKITLILFLSSKISSLFYKSFYQMQENLTLVMGQAHYLLWAPNTFMLHQLCLYIKLFKSSQGSQKNSGCQLIFKYSLFEMIFHHVLPEKVKREKVRLSRVYPLYLLEPAFY